MRNALFSSAALLLGRANGPEGAVSAMISRLGGKAARLDLPGRFPNGPLQLAILLLRSLRANCLLVGQIVEDQRQRLHAQHLAAGLGVQRDLATPGYLLLRLRAPGLVFHQFHSPAGRAMELIQTSDQPAPSAAQL